MSMASSGGNNANDKPTGSATSIPGEESESHHSRDDSIEYLRTIKKRQRKVFSRLPDQILLSLLRDKIKPSFLSWELGSSSSSSGGLVKIRVAPELRSYVKEGQPQEARLADENAKKKGPIPWPKEKKKGSFINAPAKSRAASKGVAPTIIVSLGSTRGVSSTSSLNALISASSIYSCYWALGLGVELVIISIMKHCLAILWSLLTSLNPVEVGNFIIK
ncbi:hypothetical protein Acr_10g0004260 [Actinidia rufa]|uniref:Uncharacterized protein n=1 Tax=Actinidia rufa TaxID=165716 RepID=A0A7J0F8S2_9ERIC|nr:hypothetical protein Acr_10g0004260 [Actinidia rufa]